MHMGKKAISDKQSDIPPIVIPPRIAFEIKDDFRGNLCLKHLRLQGLVEVKPAGSKDGFPLWDVDGAKKEAYAALRASQEELVKRYVTAQREDRISDNKPPMPPSAVVSEIIEDLNIDLAAMGINLAGAGFSISTKAETQNKEEMLNLKAQLLETQKNMQQMMSTQASLMKYIEQLEKAQANPETPQGDKKPEEKGKKG